MWRSSLCNCNMPGNELHLLFAIAGPFFGMDTDSIQGFLWSSEFFTSNQ